MQTPPEMPDQTIRRKAQHLDLCAEGDVEPRQNDTLFSEVQLVHDCLPELRTKDLDTSASFLGKRLSLPLMITGMSGGAERAARLNADLARLAEELGIAMGVGSQRAMAESPDAAASFQVRPHAPGAALLGNVGLWQARQLGVDGVRRLMDAIGADGMAVHLNAAQELCQPEGDRDFSQGLRTIEALARSLEDRLVVKETGCGIGPGPARKLVEAGAEILDVSGLGGTSWVRIEALRSEGSARAVGETFSGWGIPTAACVATVSRVAPGRVQIVASGGIRTGLEAAKALALGADLVGVALPVFQAWHEGGLDGARARLRELADGLRLAMALTGSRTVRDLSRRPPVVTGRLREWIAGLRRQGRVED